MTVLHIDWRTRMPVVRNLISGYVQLKFDEDFDPVNLDELIADKVVIIPYVAWVQSGLSGSSVPADIALDYSSTIFSICSPDEVHTVLSKVHHTLPKEYRDNYVHLSRNQGSTCGMKGAKFTEKLSEVTCENCKFEMFNLPMFNQEIH